MFDHSDHQLFQQSCVYSFLKWSKIIQTFFLKIIGRKQNSITIQSFAWKHKIDESIAEVLTHFWIVWMNSKYYTISLSCHLNILKHTCSWHDKLIVLWILNRQAKISLWILNMFVFMLLCPLNVLISLGI